jgi:hypothetical protein
MLLTNRHQHVYALSFNGTDQYVNNFGEPDDFFGSSDFTLSFWAKLDDNSRAVDIILDKGNITVKFESSITISTTDYKSLTIDLSDTNGNNTIINFGYAKVGSLQVDNHFHYYVFQKNGNDPTNFTLHRDGIAIDNNVYTAKKITNNVGSAINDLTSASSLRLGYDGTDYFKGYLDEILIQKSLVTLNQIQDRFNNFQGAYISSLANL